MSRGGKRGRGENGFEDFGGYMAAKISKLENQYQDELNQGASTTRLSNIFNSVAIFVNGHTTPSAEELKRLMITHGGVYHHYLNSRTTTHIIASNLCDAKIKQLKGDEIIVKPEWIVDSIAAGNLLDHKPYLLYTGILDKGQQKLQFAPIKPSHQPTPATQSPVKESAKGSHDTNSRHFRAGDDNFISEFYNRSRLHHISTMGALFKRFVTELKEKSESPTGGLEEIEKWKEATGCQGGGYQSDEPVIMHIDMDCFFVSVGLRNHPELRGEPVVVTHARSDAKPAPRREGSNREFEFDCYKEHWIKKSKYNAPESGASTTPGQIFPRLQDLDETCSMSEIASCSYEARAAGIYNGMFLGGALKLCPNLKTIPYDFDGYKEVSYALYNTVATYTLQIEAVSCDEMYADITSVLKTSGLTPPEFATHLREVIFNRTQCNASIGMGPSLLMARLATKKAKPNGLFHVSRGVMGDFMKGHNVDDLPGVGRSMTHRLRAMGVSTCEDLQQVALGKLQHEFGAKQGQTLYHMCRGEDKREIKSDHVRKSVSAEINYGIRFGNEPEMYKFVQDLSAEVSRRMEEVQVKGRLLTLKLKVRAKDAPVETAKFMGHGVCDSISRSTALAAPTRDPAVFHRETMALLRQLKVDCCEMRGMGIQLSKLQGDSVRGPKGKQQVAKNAILNFMTRPGDGAKKEAPQGKSSPPPPAEVPPPVPVVEECSPSLAEVDSSSSERAEEGASPPSAEVEREESSSRRSSVYELPSVSQMDTSVFDHLPDDLKAEILDEYRRKGVATNAIRPNPSSTSAGPSTSAPTVQSAPSASKRDSASKGRSYETIQSVADIDPDYWSALPDEIKAEIEGDFQRRKVAAEPATKNWSSIFKGRKSPVKGTITGKRKGKAEASSRKIPAAFKPVGEAQKIKPAAAVPEKPKIAPEASIPDQNRQQGQQQNQQPSLSGATELADVRMLLKEWLESSDSPEEEDREAVRRYLVALVSNQQLDHVEPLLLFLNRRTKDRSVAWKRTVEEIVNHVQLYVIQYYNGPLKLPAEEIP